MVERLQVTRETARVRIPTPVSTPQQTQQKQESRYSRADLSRINKQENNIRVNTERVKRYEALVEVQNAKLRQESNDYANRTGRYANLGRAEAAYKADPNNDRNRKLVRSLTKSYRRINKNVRRSISDDRRKAINRRQDAQRRLQDAIGDLARAKQGRTSKKQEAKVKAFTEEKERKEAIADSARRMIKSRSAKVGTVKVEVRSRILGAKRGQPVLEKPKAILRDLRTGEIVKQKDLDKKEVSKVKGVIEGLRQRVLGTKEEKIAAVKRSQKVRETKSFVAQERISSKERIQLMQIDKALSSKVPPPVKSGLRFATKLTATTKRLARGVFIDFPAEAVGGIDKVILLGEFKVRGSLDKQGYATERAKGKIAAREAVRQAVRDPVTYVFALLGAGSGKLSRTFRAVKEVKKTPKLPKSNTKAKPNTLFVNEATGRLAVSDSTGLVRPAGKIKDAGILTTAKIKRSVNLAKKIESSSSNLRKARGAVLKAKATPKQSKLVQATERAKLERRADSFVKTQIREFSKAKTVNLRDLKALGFKSESEFLRSLRLTGKKAEAFNLKRLKRLNDAQLRKLATRKTKATKARRSATIKRKRKESPLGKGIAELTKNFNKQLNKIRVALRKNKSKKAKLDREARKLGFTDHAELTFWRKTSASAARGNKIAQLRIKIFEKRFAARKTKLANKNKREIDALVKKAQDVVVVLPKTRKLSKAKRSAKDIRGRKEQPLSNFQFTINGKAVNPNKVIDLSPTPKTTASVSAPTPQGLVTVLKKVSKSKRPKPRLRIKTKAPVVRTLIRNKTIARLSQASGVAISLKRASGVRLGQNQFSKLAPKSDVIIDIAVVSKPKLDAAIKIVAAQAQRITQVPALKLKTVLKTPVRTKRTVRKPAKIKKALPKLPELKVDPTKFKGGYAVYVKTKTRWVRANPKPLTKSKAQALGKYVADNSISASYVVGQAIGKPVKPLSKISKVAASKFRSPVRKSKLPTNTRIERRKRRLDTRGEKKRISVARVLAQRRKKS